MTTPTRDDVLKTIKAGSRSRSRRWMWIALGLLAALAAAFFVIRSRGDKEDQVQFETVAVDKGGLTETVIATGTLSPLDAVEVGAEVSGKVTKVTVDVNDRVTAGQVIAEIDTEQLEARVQESQAQLSNARASRTSAEATVREAELKEKRVREMHQRGLVSSQELETAQAVLDRARASVKSSSAQVTVAQAGTRSAKTQLGKAVITSPIDGVVLARSVEPGATVTAGFQTPVLFTLAKDLKQLTLEVEIDEADIGRVREGQSAHFDVDAYPKKKFDSKVIRLHNLPKPESAVVTYLAVLSVDNTDLLLRPGMTATATIVTNQLDDVLLVPNAALRYTPPRTGGDEERSSRGPGLPFPGMGRRGGGRGGPRGGGNSPAASASAGPRNNGAGASEKVFVLENGKPKRVRVSAEATDGMRTAVESKDLQPGAQVIVGSTTGSP